MSTKRTTYIDPTNAPQTALPHAAPVSPARATRRRRGTRVAAAMTLGLSAVLAGSAVAAQADPNATATAQVAAGIDAPAPGEAQPLTIGDEVIADAEQTLAEAQNALQQAVEGVETGELRDQVHALSRYDEMPRVSVVGLVDEVESEVQEVVAQTASVKEEIARQEAEAQRAAEEKARQDAAAAAAAAAAGTPEGAKAAARDIAAAEYGWGDDQFGCLSNLWTKESGWNYRATNPSSGAYGIPQSLPGSKMASVGADWQTNPVTQIRWGLQYIAAAYGTPCAAWGHSQAVNWY